jgi:hypothetical protein
MQNLLSRMKGELDCHNLKPDSFLAAFFYRLKPNPLSSVHGTKETTALALCFSAGSMY